MSCGSEFDSPPRRESPQSPAWEAPPLRRAERCPKRWTGTSTANSRLVYVSEAGPLRESADALGWKAASLFFVALLVVFFALFLIFIYLWATKPPGPCPPPPPNPQPFPPGAPGAFPTPTVAAFSLHAGACKVASPEDVSQLALANQADRPVALYYAAAIPRSAGETRPCQQGASFSPQPAAFDLRPGQVRSVAAYRGAELEVYVIGEREGTAVPVFVDGAVAAQTFVVPAGRRAAVAVTGSAAEGYAAFVTTSRTPDEC